MLSNRSEAFTAVNQPWRCVPKNSTILRPAHAVPSSKSPKFSPRRPPQVAEWETSARNARHGVTLSKIQGASSMRETARARHQDYSEPLLFGIVVGTWFAAPADKDDDGWMGDIQKGDELQVPRVRRFEPRAPGSNLFDETAGMHHRSIHRLHSAAGHSIQVSSSLQVKSRSFTISLYRSCLTRWGSASLMPLTRASGIT